MYTNSYTNNSIFIIAEAGSNWRQGTEARDLQMAFSLIDVASDAGADAVKFQTFRAKDLYVHGAGESAYLAKHGIKESINDVIKDLEMPYQMIAKLAEYCKGKSIGFMSSPFSVNDVNNVDPYVEVHKIASYEINHIRLLECIAATGKPVILSTGAANQDEIEFALDTLNKNKSGPITLLQCTSSYPAPMDSLNLGAIRCLAEKYSVRSGLSDHSRDPVVAPVVAVAMGAKVIEKHFTLHNKLPGADHPFAITPEELALMVKAIRDAELTLGSGDIEVHKVEGELRQYATRSLQALKDIKAGELLEEGVNFDILRPGNMSRGVSPQHINRITGKTVKNDIKCGEGILMENLED